MVNKSFASKVLKSLKNLNPKCIIEIFEIKDMAYDLMDSEVLFQPKITYCENI